MTLRKHRPLHHRGQFKACGKEGQKKKQKTAGWAEPNRFRQVAGGSGDARREEPKSPGSAPREGPGADEKAAWLDVTDRDAARRLQGDGLALGMAAQEQIRGNLTKRQRCVVAIVCREPGRHRSNPSSHIYVGLRVRNDPGQCKIPRLTASALHGRHPASEIFYLHITLLTIYYF